MLKINSTIPISFKSANQQNSKKITDGQKTGIGITVAAITAVGIYTLSNGKKSAFSKALAKQGVELKDGVALVKETGEKYTGAIKRNIRLLGLKKETVQYDNGIITEKVYHDFWGKEIAGEFYKDGILRIKIPGILNNGKRKTFPVYTYDKTGKLTTMGDNFGSEIDSVFELMRNKVKILK